MTSEAALRELARRSRQLVIKMCAANGRGYAGQGLELADILSVLFGKIMRQAPDGTYLDRFVLSTGHDAIALYAILGALSRYEESVLLTYGQDGTMIDESPLAGTPGFEITGGSLGQGLSQALGMALAARHRSEETVVFCEVSDGELEEGQVWEALMAASHFGVDNLVVIINNNGEQADGRTADIMGVEPVEHRLTSFGWWTRSVDGHDIGGLISGFEEALAARRGRPAALICSTVPGKGSKTLENYRWVHYVSAGPEVWARALADLEPMP